MALPDFEKNYNDMQDVKGRINNLAVESVTPEKVGTPGWYRIAKISGTGHPANTSILSISTAYIYNPPCSVLVNVTTSWKAAKIEQGPAVNTYTNNPPLTKIRVQYDEVGAVFYVDVYYTMTGINNIHIKNENILKDKIEILTPTLVETEYTTVDEVPVVYGGRNGIETVTGTNGTAIKFPDGTMIVHGYLYIEGFSFKQWGVLYSADLDTNISFPVAFVDTPHITMTNIGSSAASIIRCIANKTAITQISLSRGTELNGGFSFNYTAIGRWK